MDASGLDQETVERLLAGRSGDAPSAPPGLVAVLAAVRAAPGAGELDGEAAAVAAFHAARRVRRRRVRLAARVAVSALAACLTSGVAIAATGDPRPAARPPVPPGVPAPPTPPARPGPPAGTPAPRTPQPSAPSGLCVAYRALAEKERGRALAAPAFTDLVAAAGGRDRVPDYCAGLLAGDDPPGRAGTRGGGRFAPAGHPSGGPPRMDVPEHAGPPAGTRPGRRTG
ncbi:hypothetical protein [Micromonospora sp. NPDC048887]|uniref:hypothetical protein n=1 Tax=unclassified Micromonospora TaxID=2617518 RepID=UPI0033CF1074